MKNIILIIVCFATASICYGQTKRPLKKTTANQPVVSKFGALAVDRSNGFYYGWSSNYSTLAEAERKAIDECNKKGGNCSVVLSYAGTGCAAYRTIDGNVGTAFGWGLAKTKEAADAIAIKECLKRSNGSNPTNFVWSCNSSNTGTLKEIYNASEEIEVPVKIGNQVWTTKNLNVSTFRNGEPIFYASNQKEWERASREQIPAYCYLNFDNKNEKRFAKLYNFYAVADRRGLAPEGWHVPSRNEFLTLIAALGGEKVAGVKMRGTKGWDVKDSYNFAHGNGDNSSGLNLLSNGSASGDEYGGGQSFKYGVWLSYWWSATARDNTFAYYLDFNKYSEPRVTDYSKTTGCAVRLVKN
ncbi:FISUMP domain-containing protein [Pedobacter helvus]|uniref:FISUMP domain-containing protein n=1 Tax=Pedobacter helvus TaxID=2563444 RepID=A0ABW9JD68_9SPHI|nr:FISUMP domain-containing protein [Pedobacter ureilyticus]